MLDVDKLLDPQYWKVSSRKFYKKNIAFSKKEQIELFKDLSRQLRSGVSILEAFLLFAQNYDGTIGDVSKDVIKSISEGGMIADGINDWAPDEVVTSLRVGETQGVLESTLDNIVDYLNATSAGLGLFIAKSIYPVMIIGMATIMAYFVDENYYKLLEEFLPLERWPESSILMYRTWGFILDNGLLIILAFLAIGTLISNQLSRLTGKSRMTLDEYPIFKGYRVQQGAIFLKTLGLLLINGVSLKDALSEIERSSTPYMTFHIRRMRQKIAAGVVNEGDSLSTGLLTKDTVNRLKTLSSANDFEVAMVELGNQTLDDSVKKLTLSATLLQTILMMIAGLAIASAILGPFLLSQALS
ncbi:MAG: type II secretory pathway component PulF [Oleiphilaceae bacterium]|jgi:type II secretory pathway component PulF